MVATRNSDRQWLWQRPQPRAGVVQRRPRAQKSEHLPAVTVLELLRCRATRWRCRCWCFTGRGPEQVVAVRRGAETHQKETAEKTPAEITVCARLNFLSIADRRQPTNR
ncbi:hypothetical protein BHM03_00042911 [Ensete ventricosum]|nr:hypothetical protein BHM03_00042911 [Ensete ventricosum]